MNDINMNDSQKFDFFAFISYKHEDEKWARWLHQKLEHYRLPTIITNKNSHLPPRLKPVFRDTTDIKPGELKKELETNLETSKHLVVVCSPCSAQSQWVGKEISGFIQQGKEKQIHLFIIEGIPYSGSKETECFHEVIKEQLPEMLGANVNEAGIGLKYIKKQKAFIRLVATMLDVSFDSLWKRQKRRIIRNTLLTFLSGLMIITAGFASSYYQYYKNLPFTSHILFYESTTLNENLPFKNGTVLLHYDNDTLIRNKIDNDNKTVKFKNIAGKFYNTKASIHFEMHGFNELDTIINLQDTILLKIARDKNTFGKVKGYVRNTITDEFMDKAKIEIEGQITFSNSEGYFSVFIPLLNQKVIYKARIYYNDIITEADAYPMQNNPNVTNTFYLNPVK
ncbi:TIR domain-containing protein [Maribellus comscasis]|uniref:TIR domain-containing protein n=1 Tax=Maribellus comscasis TaxID=2681766 RepID=A0A6I6K6J6_9BACT|nr:toll/interleukin-1 receptor domain-containing protein [Maribellus comscasis]QGY47283.1 TIR domain-containing protein [Maribellus comscasis]